MQRLLSPIIVLGSSMFSEAKEGICISTVTVSRQQLRENHMSILSFVFGSNKQPRKVEPSIESEPTIMIKSSDIFNPTVDPDTCVTIDFLRKNGRPEKALSMAIAKIKKMEADAPHAEQNYRDNDRASWEAIDFDMGPYDPTEIDGIIEEQDGRVPWGVTPSPYEQAAMIYRKRKDYAAEVDILQRFAQMEHCIGRQVDQLLTRLDRANELKQKATL